MWAWDSRWIWWKRAVRASEANTAHPADGAKRTTTHLDLHARQRTTR